MPSPRFVFFLPIFSHVEHGGTDLDDVSQVAVGSQLQALPLCPRFDGGQPLAESCSPVVGAQTWTVGLWTHELVKEPGTDEMEELGEELDGEGRVDPTAA